MVMTGCRQIVFGALTRVSSSSSSSSPLSSQERGSLGRLHWPRLGREPEPPFDRFARQQGRSRRGSTGRGARPSDGDHEKSAYPIPAIMNAGVRAAELSKNEQGK